VRILSSLALSILRALVYILPAYIANSTPVLVGGGPPLDLGRNFIDGRRIFGDNKTIRGFVGGIILGTLTGFLLPLIYPLVNLAVLSLTDYLILAFLLSIGTHAGDLLGSFIKRRLNLRPGAPFPIMDQIGFIILAIAFAWPIYPLITLFEVIVVILITLAIHPASNIVAYLLGLKDEPW